MSTTHVPASRTPRGAASSASGAALAAVVTLITLAFLWPTVTVRGEGPARSPSPAPPPRPHRSSRASTQRAPGVFDVATATDRAAAVDLIETREVYGAVVLGDAPEILDLDGRQRSSSRSSSRRCRPCSPSRSGRRCPVTDRRPARCRADPRGAVLGLVTFPLVIGGMIGGILVSILVVGVWRRVTRGRGVLRLRWPRSRRRACRAGSAPSRAATWSTPGSSAWRCFGIARDHRRLRVASSAVAASPSAPCSSC